MINEVKGIAMQNRINDFEIVYFDHGIQKVEKLSVKEVVSYKPTAVGGGGTSFKEPLEYMNQINKKGDLDLAVFITDGYADLNLPVPNFKNKFIWVIIDHASFEAPFGSKIVHITVKEGK
jgi:predicted metal-dependent peptidase